MRAEPARATFRRRRTLPKGGAALAEGARRMDSESAVQGPTERPPLAPPFDSGAPPAPSPLRARHSVPVQNGYKPSPFFPPHAMRPKPARPTSAPHISPAAL